MCPKNENVGNTLWWSERLDWHLRQIQMLLVQTVDWMDTAIAGCKSVIVAC
jgi:hypothetical protein